MFFKGPRNRKVTFPENLKEKTADKLIDSEIKSSWRMFVVAIILILAGVVLISLGVESDSTIAFSFKNLKLDLREVMPGVTLCILGIIIMWRSPINIKVKK